MKSPMKNMAYWKAKNSPVKHTRSRKGHMETYGKGHTNKDHPDYWKRKGTEKDSGWNINDPKVYNAIIADAERFPDKKSFEKRKKEGTLGINK